MWGRFFASWSQRDAERDLATLTVVVRRIVNAVQPQEVVLFGSAARGKLRPDSDFDLLVIKSGEFDPRALSRYIYAHLFDISHPIDVLVATPEQIEASQYKLLGRIYAQGRRLYSSPAAPRYAAGNARPQTRA